MARKPRFQYAGAVYHAIARGNAKRQLFFTPADWRFCLDAVGRLKAKTGLRLFAYCLMPNHIHLLIQPSCVGLSVVMGSLLNRYAKYINARLKSTGHVFQERFRSPLCKNDAHLLQLARYIHLNPVRAGLAADPADWPYSSYRDYLGCDGGRLAEPAPVLALLSDDMAAARLEFSRFVQAGMESACALPVELDSTEGNSTSANKDLMPSRAASDQARGMTIEKFAGNYSFRNGASLAAVRSAARLRSICRSRREFIQAAFFHGCSLTDIAGYLNVTVAAASQAVNAGQTTLIT